MYHIVWCIVHAGRHRADTAKAVAVAKGRVKDPESARALEVEMLETAEYLDINAALAMADMLLVRRKLL
jgi:hypothetical protein